METILVSSVEKLIYTFDVWIAIFLTEFSQKVRRRRPDTRLNLQYDRLYVNNVAYWYNDDTEDIETVNQTDGDHDGQVLYSLLSKGSILVFYSPFIIFFFHQYF